MLWTAYTLYCPVPDTRPPYVYSIYRVHCFSPQAELHIITIITFFIPFIMVTTFAVVNLLVGLIVNSMQEAHHEEENAETGAYRDSVNERLIAIEQRLDILLEQRNRN